MNNNMQKIMKKMCVIILMIIVMFFVYNLSCMHLYATEGGTDDGPYDFWTGAQEWYNKPTDGIEYLDNSIMKQIAEFIKFFGTAVIAIVSVVLGMKYMIGGVNGKAEVKQQLVGLLVACLFFFGWSNISDLLITNAQYDENTGTYTQVSSATQLFVFSNVDTYQKSLAKIFAIVLFFAKIVAIVAIMVIGAKYIFSGANGKAELKQKGPMFIIGILMIFSTLNILSFISTTINQALSI